jgi:hypothetical protein
MLTITCDRETRSAAAFQDESSSVYIHVPEIPILHSIWRQCVFTAIGVRDVDFEAAVIYDLLVLIFAGFHRDRLIRPCSSRIYQALEDC